MFMNRLSSNSVSLMSLIGLTHRLAIVVVVVVSLMACAGSDGNLDRKPDDRPNIILVIADDLSWNDLGCYGHPSISTPHIDQLAEQGMLFNRAFLTASSCSPSRASIITGKFPHQTDAEQLHWPLPADQITFVEKLRDAGYWAAQSGKWHLGDAVEDRFDTTMQVSVDGFQVSKDGTMTMSTNASGCEDWIGLLNARPRNQPFFLWLAAVDPHRDYREGIIENPHTVEEVVVPPYLPDTRSVRQDLALYYDEVSRLDSFVGLLTRELDKEGLAENTLILFISDNGRPFPRDKTTLYDGGIKTPWIVRWPRQVRPGSSSGSMVSAIDIAPTFLYVAGVDKYGDFEGVSFMDVLRDPESVVRTSIFAEDHWHDYEDYSRAIRTERYKYIRNFYYDLPNTPSADALRSPTFRAMQELEAQDKLPVAQRACFLVPRPEKELYDLLMDPFEIENLVADRRHRDLLATLRDEMQQMRRRTNDRLPDKRTPDEFDRSTGQPNQFRIRPRPSKAEMTKQ